MMTPAQFKAARAAVIEASKWNASRIRGEMAECIEISNTTEVHVAVPAVVRERAEAIALAGGWRVSTREIGDRVILGLETGGPAANVDLEVYRGPVAIILPTAAEHHVRVMGLVRLTRGEALELVDDALAAAMNNGGDPRVRVRRHSAYIVVDVATVAGWATHAVDPESFATCKAHEHVDITLHAEPVAGREPLSSRMPRSMPAETGCEVCGAWWLMTPDGSVCVNGHPPRRGWT